MTPEQVLRLQAAAMRTFAEVAQQMLDRNPEVTAEELVRLIEADAAGYERVHQELVQSELTDVP